MEDVDAAAARTVHDVAAHVLSLEGGVGVSVGEFEMPPAPPLPPSPSALPAPLLSTTTFLGEGLLYATTTEQQEAWPPRYDVAVGGQQRPAEGLRSLLFGSTTSHLGTVAFGAGWAPGDAGGRGRE